MKSKSSTVLVSPLLACIFAVLQVCPAIANSGNGEVKAAETTSSSAEKVLKPNDNLIVQGVTPIPLSLVDEVEAYTNFRSASLADWHPVRREMIINTRFADSNQLHVVTEAGGARTQLTFYPDSAQGGQYQPANGSYCVFQKDRGGDEFFQKYRYDFATKKATQFTDGKSRNTGGIWSNAGKLYAYTSTRRNGKDTDIYVVDPSAPDTNKCALEVDGGGWDVLDWSADDNTLLLMNELSINESYLYSLNLTTGEKKELTPKPAKAGAQTVYYEVARFSKDGKFLYVTTDREGEFKRLAKIRLEDGKIQYLSNSINWDVWRFELSDDGAHIAFIANEDGAGRLHVLETRTDKEIPLRNLPNGVVTGIKWHKNSHDLGFEAVSAKSPEDVYSLDISTGKVDRWTNSETGMIDSSAFPEAELVHWRSFDGRTISGFLYKPPAKFTGKRPLIVNIHGGPESQYRPQFLGKWNYVLNELGCAVLFPNIRGSNGYGKTFLKLDNGNLRADSYKDIDAALTWTRTRSDVDPDKVMVTGGSYGGHVTLAMATLYSDKITCALDVVGPSNLVTFLENTQAYRRDLRRIEYGDERDPNMRAYLEKIAPSKNAAMIKKPLFVVQGQNDPRVPASESEQMVEAVRNNGVPVWFLMAKDEGHGFQKKTSSDFQFYATIQFIKSYLLK